MKLTLHVPQSVVDAIREGRDLEATVIVGGASDAEPEPEPPPSPVIVWRGGPVDPPPAGRIVSYAGAVRPAPDSLPPGTRHLYSRQAALSPRGDYALLMQPDGHFIHWRVDTDDRRIIHPDVGLAGGNCDANVTPDGIYCVGRDGSLLGANRFHPVTGNPTAAIARLTGGNWKYAHSGAEGRPSRYGNLLPFMLFDAAFNCTHYGAWDVAANKWALLLENLGDKPNHVTMSPSGQHFLVSRADTGANRGDDPRRHAGTWAYSLVSNEAYRLAHGSQHSDVCTDRAGRDYFIYADFDSQSRYAGKVWYAPIDHPDDRTVVLDTYGPNHERQNNAFHFSGCGPDGWVLASAYGRAPAPTERVAWWDNRIFAIELGGERRVALLAEHGSVYTGDYWQEPHACWSSDGSRAIFASNNGDATAPVRAYVIDLPVLR